MTFFKKFIFIVLICWGCHCAGLSPISTWDTHQQPAEQAPDELRRLVATITAADKPVRGNLSITYPYAGSLFPPDIAAPTLLWEDGREDSRRWLIRLQFSDDRQPIYALTTKKNWMPEPALWERIKAAGLDKQIRLTVFGLNGQQPVAITGHDTRSFSVSPDPVNASIFYRQVPLPFLATEEGFKRTRWRLGDISSYDEPAVVMTDIPVCASCHAFSRDGRRLSMEMNLNHDNGAQFIVPVQKEIVLTSSDFMSWSEFPRSDILPPTRGLFGRMSPSGKYLAASVNEISYAALIEDIAFSQLFFPTYGVLAWYSAARDRIRLLPGADDKAHVQANPVWSPDEKYIVFARAPIKNEVHADITKVVSHQVDGDIHEMNEKFSIQFDLYRIPFNKGRGGTAEPLAGASHNGMSNYFAKYSPDGRWIVFTRSRSGIMLQPDSQLYIIPAEGGPARRMNCNRKLFNSWHAWSPNGKWLLFTSKVNTPYTEIFLTHIDDQGNDTPPVLLERFSAEEYAANVPEFAPFGADAIKSMRLAAD